MVKNGYLKWAIDGVEMNELFLCVYVHYTVNDKTYK